MKKDKILEYFYKKIDINNNEDLFKKERPDFEKKWDDIKIFVQYGMISDEKFYEKAAKFALLKTTGINSRIVKKPSESLSILFGIIIYASTIYFLKKN